MCPLQLVVLIKGACVWLKGPLCRCHVNWTHSLRWSRVFVSHANSFTPPVGEECCWDFLFWASEDLPFGMKWKKQDWAQGLIISTLYPQRSQFWLCKQHLYFCSDLTHGALLKGCAHRPNNSPEYTRIRRTFFCLVWGCRVYMRACFTSRFIWEAQSQPLNESRIDLSWVAHKPWWCVRAAWRNDRKRSTRQGSSCK